jgi:hypothetical protein
MPDDLRSRIPVRAADKPLKLECAVCNESYWLVYGIEEIKSRFRHDEPMRWRTNTMHVVGNGDEQSMGFRSRTGFSVGQEERVQAAKRTGANYYVSTLCDEANSSKSEPEGRFEYEDTRTHRWCFNKQQNQWVRQNYPVWRLKLVPKQFKQADQTSIRHRDVTAIFAMAFKLIQERAWRLGWSYRPPPPLLNECCLCR